MTTNDTPNQPMKIQLIFNECSCPTSSFLKEAPPSSMTIEAVVGAPVTQVLGFQQDLANKLYGTDCGTYSVRLTPSLPFLTTSSVGGKFTDRMVLGAANLKSVGVYSVTMWIEQIAAIGNGY